MKAGTSSGRPQSAVLVPVPIADSVVGHWRHEHDPVAMAGVPAHITLIVPWLPPDDITDADLEGLDEEVRAVPAFPFDLTHVDWFGRRVLWVAPEPAQPFLDLTNRLAQRFGTPPWAGEFDEVVPHLTVAHATGRVELVPIACDLAGKLPLHCQATEVWVMVGDGTSWSCRHRVALG